MALNPSNISNLEQLALKWLTGEQSKTDEHRSTADR